MENTAAIAKERLQFVVAIDRSNTGELDRYSVGNYCLFGYWVSLVPGDFLDAGWDAKNERCYVHVMSIVGGSNA